MKAAVVRVLHPFGARERHKDLRGWVVAALPGAEVEEQDIPEGGILPLNWWLDSDLVVVDASGSVAPESTEETSASVVQRLREEDPYLPIVCAIVPPPQLGWTIVEHAQVRMIQAGATEVAAVAAESPDSYMLLKHRIERALRGRPRRRAEAESGPRRERALVDAGQPVPFDADMFRTPWMELYHPTSQRLDATRIASALGTKLRPLTTALGLSYKAVHRAPDAPAYQAALRPVARILEMLRDTYQHPEYVRAWLNQPRADLEGDSPLAVILEGEVDAVVSLLEGVQLGIGF